MDDTPEAGAGGTPSRASLRVRVAAQDVMAEFLRAQADVAPRSSLARFFGASVLSEESWPWYRDVLGELAVGASLERLDEAWVVLHAVPLGENEPDIDHIVIGPGGVFAITTRNFSDQSVWIASGAFEVAGNKHNHIRNSEFEVGRVERLLGAAVGSTVHATGVIAVIDPKNMAVRELPRDVAVVTADEVVAWLESRPAVLSASEVDRLAELAEKPSTWLWSIGDCEEDGPTLRARFDEVRREVRTARTVRRLWLIATSSALAGALALAAWGIAMAATPTVIAG